MGRDRNGAAALDHVAEQVSTGAPVSLDDFFAEHDDARALYESVRAVIESMGPVEVRISKSQIAFRRRVAFAWVWLPGRYLAGDVAPLVLTVGLPRRDASPRWKQVVEPRPGHFTHHLELRSADQVDAEVARWLREGREAAE